MYVTQPYTINAEFIYPGQAQPWQANTGGLGFGAQKLVLVDKCESPSTVPYLVILPDMVEFWNLPNYDYECI